MRPAHNGNDRLMPEEESPRLERVKTWRFGYIVPLVCFGIATVVAFPLFLAWGRHGWFTQDDWDFLSARTAWDLGDLFRPHFQHWSTLGILAYRLMWVLVGLRNYSAYQAMLVALHLVAAGLLLAVMWRAGVRPWLACLVAGIFVYFGAGAENILVAFNVTFVGSLVFGLVQLLLADHDGPLDRRDWFALSAGFAGLLCSGVMLTMAFIVGLAVLLRRGPRGWRVALFHTAPLAGAYLVWVQLAPKGQNVANYHSQNLSQVFRFVGIGIENTFARLGYVWGVGAVLGLLLLGGMFVLFRGLGWRTALGRYAPTIALLVGAIAFLTLAGIERSGQGGLLGRIPGSGPERARESRYVHLVAAMTLPALALGAQALIRRWRALAIPIVAALLVGVPGNVRLLARPNQYFANARATRVQLLALPHLPMADQLRHSKRPVPFQRFVPEGLTIGWLVDSADAGRLPAAPKLAPAVTSRMVLDYFLVPVISTRPVECRPADRISTRVLERGDRLTIERGGVFAAYDPLGGTRSTPVVLKGETVMALVGPMRLRITRVFPGVLLCA
jgi:hypothetical protein